MGQCGESGQPLSLQDESRSGPMALFVSELCCEGWEQVWVWHRAAVRVRGCWVQWVGGGEREDREVVLDAVALGS